MSSQVPDPNKNASSKRPEQSEKGQVLSLEHCWRNVFLYNNNIEKKQSCCLQSGSADFEARPSSEGHFMETRFCFLPRGVSKFCELLEEWGTTRKSLESVQLSLGITFPCFLASKIFGPIFTGNSFLLHVLYKNSWQYLHCKVHSIKRHKYRIHIHKIRVGILVSLRYFFSLYKAQSGHLSILISFSKCQK